MAPNPPWADLHPELLSAIANLLTPNPIDILRFRAVCKSWFSILSLYPPNILSPLLPLTVPPPAPSLRSASAYSFEIFVLSVTAVYAFRPPGIAACPSTPKTWIAFIDEIVPGKVSIRYPFTKGQPFKPCVFPRKLNLLDFHASEIGRYCNVTRVNCTNGIITKPKLWSLEVHKVVFLTNGDAILAIFDKGKLGMLRLGLGSNVADTEWKVIHDGKNFSFDDIIEYKGRMLGIDRRGRVYEISCYSSEMNIIVPSVRGGGGGEMRKRFIESSGVLYLVAMCNERGATEETGLFKVYGMDEKLGKWVERTDFGEWIFFFGDDFSFAVSAREFEVPFGKNCIIFQKRSFQKYGAKLTDHWVFDGLSCSHLYVGIYNVEDGARLHSLESHPHYSNIAWPPPSWLWRDKMIKPVRVFEKIFDRLYYRILTELKTNFIDRFSLVVAMISGEGFSPQDIPDILKDADMLNKFLGELVVELQMECKKVKRDIAKEALSKRKQIESINVLNQEGQTEDRNVCVGTVRKKVCTVRKKASKPYKGEIEWRKAELSRRLCTHNELLELFRGVISVIGEKNVKNDMETRNKLLSLLGTEGELRSS